MAITKLDNIAALVVIDLQKGIVSMPTVHSVAEIVDRSAQLAHAFRERGWPVVLVNVTGPPPGRTDQGARTFSFPEDWTELVPELGQQPSDLLISKQRWGAFIGTALDAELRKLGVTQIVLTGLATSAGVESTARSAYDLGYNVAIVLDAITDRDATAHQHCIEKVFPRMAETDTTENLLKLLQK
jgi:nicotinamidase-related amidase